MFTGSVELAYGLPPRSFASFKEAGAEAAISRLYGGIHYRVDLDAGNVQGARVGRLVVDRLKLKKTHKVKPRYSMLLQLKSSQLCSGGIFTTPSVGET